MQSSRTHTNHEFARYFALLGLPINATEEQIKEAFKQKALIHHPDKVPEGEKAAAAQKFIAAKEARDKLLNRYQNASSARVNHPSDIVTDIPKGTIDPRDLTFKGRLDLPGADQDIPQNVHMPRNLPRNKMCTFYAYFPTLGGSLQYSPLDILGNTSSAKERYFEIFVDKKEALKKLLHGSSMTRMGKMDSAIDTLQTYNFVPNGVVYALEGVPSIILDCFKRGNFEILIPLMTRYYIPKTHPLPADIIQLHERITAFHLQSWEEPSEFYKHKAEFENCINNFSRAVSSLTDHQMPKPITIEEGVVPTDAIENVLQKLMQENGYAADFERHEAFLSEMTKNQVSLLQAKLNALIEKPVAPKKSSFFSDLFNPKPEVKPLPAGDLINLKKFNMELENCKAIMNGDKLIRFAQMYYQALISNEAKTALKTALNACLIEINTDANALAIMPRMNQPN